MDANGLELVLATPRAAGTVFAMSGCPGSMTTRQSLNDVFVDPL